MIIHEFVQDFLEGILDPALEGVPENDVIVIQLKNPKAEFKTLESFGKKVCPNV